MEGYLTDFLSARERGEGRRALQEMAYYRAEMGPRVCMQVRLRVQSVRLCRDGWRSEIGNCCREKF